MKNKLLLLCFCFMFSKLYSQVGINTENPKTTLDVSVKRNIDGTLSDEAQIYGLQAPRLTRKELTNNSAIYDIDQTGALIYITDISGGNKDNQRVNIDAVGYYYFDGNIWKKIGMSNSTGPWNISGTENSATDNKSNIYQIGNVGIGTKNPLTKLDVTGDVNITGKLNLGTASEIADEGKFSTVVRDDNSGELRVSSSKSPIAKMSFFLQSQDVQNFGNIGQSNSDNVVSFEQWDSVVDGGDFRKLLDNSFRVEHEGLYSFRAFIIFTPNSNYGGGDSSLYSAQLKIQKNIYGKWEDIGGSRHNWFALPNVATSVVLPTFVTNLKKGDLLRLVIQKPFKTDGSWSSARISSATSLPFSKSLEITKYQ